jgi:hypothetical protein
VCDRRSRTQDGVDRLRLELGTVPDGRLAETGHRHDADVGHERGLVGVVARHHDRGGPRPPRGEDGGQDAVDGPQPAVETQLAEMHDTGHGLGRHQVGRRQRGDGDREVERRTLLGQRRRRQVDRELAGRERAAGVRRGRADPVAGLAERRVGQPDDHEGRQPLTHVGLDLDERPVEAEQ